MSPSCNAADQAMLLRDLERRIKTMALAEEHQVVDATAVANVGSGGASERERGDGVTSSSSNRDGGENREGRSQSCFMLAAYRSLSPPSSSAPRPPPPMVSLASPLSVDLPAAESSPPIAVAFPALVVVVDPLEGATRNSAAGQAWGRG